MIEELITKHNFEKSPMGEGILKVLYAGEDEAIEMTNEGDLVMSSADGKSSTHKVTVGEAPTTNAVDNDAEIKALEAKIKEEAEIKALEAKIKDEEMKNLEAKIKEEEIKALEAKIAEEEMRRVQTTDIEEKVLPEEFKKEDEQMKDDEQMSDF